jgi:hypothetical protein
MAQDTGLTTLLADDQGANLEKETLAYAAKLAAQPRSGRGLPGFFSRAQAGRRQQGARAAGAGEGADFEVVSCQGMMK